MASVSPWNWPMAWRVMVLLNISFYNLMGNAFAAGITPLFGAVIEDIGCTLKQASVLPGYALLGLGLANIYALALCAYIGKRYTVLISMTIFLGANIWAAKATSYNSLVGTRFVGGLAGGVIEAMGPFIVSETFPEHQLARAMVTYIGLLTSGSAFGPIFSGIIVTHLGDWRWFFWIMAILIGLNLVCCIIMLPETSFAGEWNLEVESMNEKLEKGTEIEGAENVEAPNVSAVAEVNDASYSKLQLWSERSFFLPWNMSDITRPKNARFGFVSLLLAPFPLILVPGVFISTLLFGITIGSTVIYSILSADIFAPPPHLWSAQSVGLLQVSALIGLLVGLPVGGLAADILSKIQARRSNGNHNPRSRLPLVALGFFISPTGLVIGGYSLRPNHFSWIGFAFGWALLSFGFSASANIMTTYSVDTFRQKAGHIGVLINVVKNCIGFGLSYATVSWYTEQGPVKLFGTMAGLLWASYLAVIPLYFYHKRITQFSDRLIKKIEF